MQSGVLPTPNSRRRRDGSLNPARRPHSALGYRPPAPPRIVPPKGAPNVLLIMTADVGFGARVLAVLAVGERVALLFAPSALLYLVGTTLVAAAFCFIIWYEFRAVLRQIGQREHPKLEMNACPEPLRIARGARTALVLALFTTCFSSGLAEAQATRVETLEQEFTDPLTRSRTWKRRILSSQRPSRHRARQALKLLLCLNPLKISLRIAAQRKKT